MGIKLFALFGVFLLQYSRFAADASYTNCADLCEKMRSMELQLNANLFIFCRCGSQNPRPPRATYAVVHPLTKDNDFSGDLRTHDALSYSYNNEHILPSGYRHRQTRELNFPQLPEISEVGSFVGPIRIYKKPVTVPSQLYRDVIQRKLSSLEEQLTDLNTQTNRENYFANGNIPEKNTLFDVSNEYAVPYSSQTNDGVIYHNEMIFDKQSESLDEADPPSPLYWSQNEYSVDNTIPQGRSMIMDIGLANKVEYRTKEENADSRRMMKSLNNSTTKETFKDCLNLLELQNYQSSDNMNKTMTMSIKNLLQEKYENYTAEEIAFIINVTCKETYKLFRTGVEEINNKEKIMFDKMNTSRSANPRMVQEYSSEVLSQAPSAETPSDIYWIDASTQPFKSIVKDTQVLPKPISVTNKIGTSNSEHYLPKDSFHSSIQSQENGIVHNEITAQNSHDLQTASQLQPSTEDRPVVIEKEKRVPKLVMSENKAGLQSAFGELEVIDNNDFVRENNVARKIGLGTDNKNDASFDHINITAKDHTSPEYPVISTKQNDFVQWPLSLDNLYITHQDLKLPINFAPNANGKVDILIDGQYICDQLLREPDQSLLLLQILCNANNKENIQKLGEKIKTCSKDSAPNIIV